MGNRARPRDKDKEVMKLTDDPGALPALPAGQILAENKTMVITETEARVQDEAGGKSSAMETGVLAEDTAKKRLREKEGGDQAAWFGQQSLQTHRESQKEQVAFSSVPTTHPATEVLQKPELGIPLGLLSKAAWRKSSSSSSKTSTSSTTKVSYLPSSSSSPSTLSSYRESQTATPINVSLVFANSNSSTSNISTSFDESVSSLPAWDLPTVPESLLSTVGDHDVTLPANVTSPFSTHKWNTTVPTRTRNSSRLTTTSTATINTSLSPNNAGSDHWEHCYSTTKYHCCYKHAANNKPRTYHRSHNTAYNYYNYNCYNNHHNYCTPNHHHSSNNHYYNYSTHNYNNCHHHYYYHTTTTTTTTEEPATTEVILIQTIPPPTTTIEPPISTSTVESPLHAT
nr:uncharacterized serine-rich protein C215.13-like [Labrus bergylta]